MKEPGQIEWRITEYLSAGGLFNPELMNHEKVRDLLIDCRDALAAVRADERERIIKEIESHHINGRPTTQDQRDRDDAAKDIAAAIRNLGEGP